MRNKLIIHIISQQRQTGNKMEYFMTHNEIPESHY